MGGLISFMRRRLTGNEIADPQVVSPLTPLPVQLSSAGNNLTVFRLPTSLATNNATLVHAGPASIFSINGRLAAGSAFLKFYNTAAVPNPAVDVPAAVYALNSAAPVFTFQVPVQGVFFPLGIGFALVTGAADNDNTPVAAGQVLALQFTWQPSL